MQRSALPLLSRRRAFQLTAAGLLLPLAGSAPVARWLPEVLSGTFLQIWPADIGRPAEAWRGELYLTRLLSCTEITIQWLRYGPDPGAYEVPDAWLNFIMDYAAANTIAVRLGLPYDYRYWDVLAGRTTLDLAGFLAAAAESCKAYLRQTAFGRHAAFAGWYLPYEIEQFSWRETSTAALLIDFLRDISGAVAAETLVPLAVSTFSSKLAGGDTLAALWERILDRVAIRPMVQDGVGSAGLGSYRILAPLLASLARRQIDFDIVIELFQERHSKRQDGSEFDAVSADYGRVRDQIAIAAGTGAARLLGFAVDPYMLGDRPGAGALLNSYRAGLNARSLLPPGFATRRQT